MTKLFTICLIFVTQAALAQEKDEGKNLPIPQKLTCVALDSDSKLERGQVIILSDFSGDPTVVAQSRTEPLLNFKIGKGFAAGEFHKQNSDMSCESKVSSGRNPFSFEYSCKYISSNLVFAKSSLVYSTSGYYYRQICRDILPPGMGGDICWDLKNCL